LDIRAIKTIFLGYSSNKRDTNILTQSKKKSVSKDIIFQENELYYKRKINECNLQEPSNEFSFLETIELNQEVVQMEHKPNSEQEGEVGSENEEEENSLTNE
jgi:hypothetical protein